MATPNTSAGGAVAAPPPSNAPAASIPASQPKQGGTATSVSPPSQKPAPAPPAPPSIDNPPDEKADFFTDLDAMSKPEPKAAAAAPPAAGQEPPKGQPEPPKAIPASKEERTMQSPKALRDFANRMESENKTLTGKIADYERRIADAEKKGKDTTALTEKLAAAERRLADTEKQLWALNVGESPEFKKSYEQPWLDAVSFAQETVGRIEVVTARDEEGNPTQVRQATWDDFAPIYQLARQSLSQAGREARRIFGEDSQSIMNHVNELQRLERNRAKALDDAKKNAESERDTRTAEAARQREWAADTWTRVNTDLSEQNPEYFQPDAKDKQRAEIFNKSLQTVDLRHGQQALTPIQRVTLDAQVRLRAAAYPVLKYDLNKANERITELETELAEIKDSKPGATQRPGGDTTPGTTEKSFMEELNALEA